MLSLLSLYSRSKITWFLLFASTAAFEVTALYFQHGLGLAPCTLCIYQRCAIFGIMAGSLIGIYQPRKLVFRVLGIIIWLLSAAKGLQLAMLHARLQFEPNFTDTCSINVEFPFWMPLHRLLPDVFNAYGSCSEKIWSFLTIEMSQWMIIVFGCYVLVGLVVLAVQLVPPHKRTIYS